MKCCVSGILIFYFLGEIAAVSSNDSIGRKFLRDNSINQDYASLAEGVKVEETEYSPRAPRAAEEKLNDTDSALVNRFEKFMETHTFKFNIKGSEVLETFSNAADSLGLFSESQSEEGRKRTKKKTLKMLMPLIMAIKLKLIAMVPIAMTVIAFIIKKALIVGKIALAIATALGLKQLFQGKQEKTTTYEIINHPHHTNHEIWSSDSGIHGGWGRISNDAAQDMAYKSYQPQQ